MAAYTYKWYLKQAAPTGTGNLELNRDLVNIGRAKTATYGFKSKFLSRKHGILEFIGDSWFVTDVGSTNGIYVNYSKILPKERFKLTTGDTIGFGTLVAHEDDNEIVIFELCKDLLKEDDKAMFFTDPCRRKIKVTAFRQPDDDDDDDDASDIINWWLQSEPYMNCRSTCGEGAASSNSNETKRQLPSGSCIAASNNLASISEEALAAEMLQNGHVIGAGQLMTEAYMPVITNVGQVRDNVCILTNGEIFEMSLEPSLASQPMQSVECKPEVPSSSHVYEVIDISDDDEEEPAADLKKVTSTSEIISEPVVICLDNDGEDELGAIWREIAMGTGNQAVHGNAAVVDHDVVIKQDAHPCENVYESELAEASATENQSSGKAGVIWANMRPVQASTNLGGVVKRGRGRPRKSVQWAQDAEHAVPTNSASHASVVKRGRGRPRKSVQWAQDAEHAVPINSASYAASCLQKTTDSRRYSELPDRRLLTSFDGAESAAVPSAPSKEVNNTGQEKTGWPQKLLPSDQGLWKSNGTYHSKPKDIVGNAASRLEHSKKPNHYIVMPSGRPGNSSSPSAAIPGASSSVSCFQKAADIGQTKKRMPSGGNSSSVPQVRVNMCNYDRLKNKPGNVLPSTIKSAQCIAALPLNGNVGRRGSTEKHVPPSPSVPTNSASVKAADSFSGRPVGGEKKKKREALKKKVQRKMGNRIPIPGGGNAVVMNKESAATGNGSPTNKIPQRAFTFNSGHKSPQDVVRLGAGRLPDLTGLKRSYPVDGSVSPPPKRKVPKPVPKQPTISHSYSMNQDINDPSREGQLNRAKVIFGQCKRSHDGPKWSD